MLPACSLLSGLATDTFQCIVNASMFKAEHHATVHKLTLYSSRPCQSQYLFWVHRNDASDRIKGPGATEQDGVSKVTATMHLQIGSFPLYRSPHLCSATQYFSRASIGKKRQRGHRRRRQLRPDLFSCLPPFWGCSSRACRCGIPQIAMDGSNKTWTPPRWQRGGWHQPTRWARTVPLQFKIHELTTNRLERNFCDVGKNFQVLHGALILTTKEW